jgi:hypothetical protein
MPGAASEVGPLPKAEAHGGPVPFAVIDDNVRHDTLLVQVTFDLGPEGYLMVASPVEETYEGLRLYRYELDMKDSLPHITARSSPGYDSWTLLPTFFEHPQMDSAYILLANMGERNSWGQKVMAMNDGFTDLGFLDVAIPDRITEGDSSYVRLRNIGPETRCVTDGSGIEFRFVCDSVHLYDDLRGLLDLVVPAGSVRYTWNAQQGMVLWVDGQARTNAQIP